MNCQDFNDQLHEFLDGSLCAEDQSAARRHLQCCDTCSRALLREEARAKSIGQSLRHATSDLSLIPETKRAILKGAESNKPSLHPWMRIREMFNAWPIRPLAAAVALAGGMVFLFGIYANRSTTKPIATQQIAHVALDSCVVDVPLQSEIHLFRRENNTVVDTIIPNAATGRALIAESSERLPKPFTL